MACVSGVRCVNIVLVQRDSILVTVTPLLVTRQNESRVYDSSDESQTTRCTSVLCYFNRVACRSGTFEDGCNRVGVKRGVVCHLAVDFDLERGRVGCQVDGEG